MLDMQRRYLVIWGCLLWVASLNVCHGFSLLGPLSTPANPYQTTALGYALPGDIGSPVTIGEEYRWNLPNITYSFDDSFFNYFGQQGVEAVEEALSVINNLGPVSSFSSDLSEFPIEALKANITAGSLGIRDLKSTTLSLVLEILGLADPTRWTWALRNRVVLANPARTNYATISRNFDPITYVESPTVNGVLYDYFILDPIPPINYADAIEFPRDPLAPRLNSPVTTFGLAASEIGVFATGLSRDDAGGLRFIYRGNNFHVETLVPGITLATNGVVGNVVSPWVPYFGLTNIFTNVFGTTNITATNVLVATALRPGMEAITFVRTDYDSLLSQVFVPITNVFTDIWISNRVAVLQRVQRITVQPDLLFTAEDLGFFPGSVAPILTRRGVNFINNDPVNGQSQLAGPGVLSGPARISFSNLLPAYEDFSASGIPGNSFLEGPNPLNRTVIWGWFGESADSIILFPNSFSIQDLEARVLNQ
jgi:hypothetical protein